jgi:DNA polymerase delta subunit 1
MKLILKKSDIDKAIKKVKEVTVKLLKSEVPISDLIIIKEYTKPISEFKNAKSLPIQIMVVKDLMKRDPNNAPKVGQRIPFVVIDRGTADKHSAGSCGLDPMVAMNENVDIDYMYYIEKQIKKPVVRFFVPIYGSEAKAEKYLFSWLKGITVNPDLEFKRKINPSLKAVCKICARSSDNKYGICTRCLKSSSDPLMVKLGEQFNTYLIMKEEVDKTWDICRKCQRDDDMAMLEGCKASDCGNWYDRRTTKNKLEMKVQTIEDIKTKAKPDFFNKVCLLGGAPEFTHDNKGPKIKLEMETA